MKITQQDKDLYRWLEDDDGNIYPLEDKSVNDTVKNIDSDLTYHTCFPLAITEKLYSYSCSPNREDMPIASFLYSRFSIFRKYWNNCHRSDRRFKHLIDFTTNIGGGNENVILGMVNSGDYTLSSALRIYANACERCTNVLAYKYTNGKEGYAEYSEEWHKANTCCKFCEEENK